MEKYFQFSFYITIPASNLEELSNITAQVESTLGSLLVVVLGVTTGWFLAGTKDTGKNVDNNAQVNSKGEVEEAGIGDEKSYGSTVEGVLKKGGIKGEGTHFIVKRLCNIWRGKLINNNLIFTLTRTAVLVFLFINLFQNFFCQQSFVDKKVTVWGETISAKYAGWMIDVGKIKVAK